MADGGRIGTGLAIIGVLALIIGFVYMQENDISIQEISAGTIKDEAIEALVNLEDLSIGEIQAYATDQIRKIGLTDEFGNEVAIYLPPSAPISENAIDPFRTADSELQLREAYNILLNYPAVAGLLPDFIDFEDWILQPENQELLQKEDIFKHETRLQKFQIDNPTYGVGEAVNGTSDEVSASVSSGGLGEDYKYRILSNNNPSGLPLVYLGEKIVIAGKIKLVDPTCKNDCPRYINGPHYYRGEIIKLDGTEDGIFMYATKARSQTNLNGDWGISITTGNKTPFDTVGTYQLQIHTSTADEPPRPFIYTVQFQIVEKE